MDGKLKSSNMIIYNNEKNLNFSISQTGMKTAFSTLKADVTRRLLTCKIGSTLSGFSHQQRNAHFSCF